MMKRNSAQKKESSSRKASKKFSQKSKIEFKQKQDARAMELCQKALFLWSENEQALLIKASIHIKQKEYAEAVYALEHITKISSSPIFRKKAEEQIGTIRGLVSFVTSEELELLNKPIENVFRELFCTQEYLRELDFLYKQHQQIQNDAYEEQINKIIALINFAFTYFQPNQKPVAFADKSLLDSSIDARKRRIQYVGNYAAKILIPRCVEPGRITEGLDCLVLNMLGDLGDDLFLEDSRKVFRMLFESMRCLPRDKRGDLSLLMPWKNNSWYLLEFCSTFFHACGEDNSVSTLYFEKNDSATTALMGEFQKSLQMDQCLVKVALSQLLQEDLPILHQFFSSIKAQLARPDECRIEPLGELPNLTTLLWYFKHTYQLCRLMAILPLPFDSSISLFKFKQTDELVKFSPLMALMSLVHSKETFKHNLKSRLAFLQRIQMTGEIFTSRGWGNQLDSIDYIDYELLQDIRNSLSHPEDLLSFSHIDALETNVDRLVALYKEFSLFKNRLYEVIAHRQSQFQALPNVNRPFVAWKEEMSHYWHAVKRYYASPASFDLDTFIPLTPLINAKAYKEFDACSNPEAADYTNVRNMFDGRVKMDLNYPQDELRKLLRPNMKERAMRKIFKLAEKEYKSLRLRAANAYAKQKQQEQRALKETRRDVMDIYPEIKALGLASREQLRQSAMPFDDMMACLKSRFYLLKNILIDAGLYSDEYLSEEQVMNEIVRDVEVFLSCSYLINQITSIMNKLHALGLLAPIDPRLPERLESFVSLRNALIHNDPVLESEMNLFIHMQSNLIRETACIVYELISTFFDCVNNVQMTPIRDVWSSVSTSDIDASVTRQNEALICRHQDHFPLPAYPLPTLEHIFGDSVTDSSSPSLECLSPRPTRGPGFFKPSRAGASSMSSSSSSSMSSSSSSSVSEYPSVDWLFS